MFGWFKKSAKVIAKPRVEFPYPCEAIDGALALERLQALRANGGGTPVILGGREQFERVRESLESNKATVDELLTSASTLDPLRWLEEREHEEPDQFSVAEADWPQHALPNQSLSAHLDIRTRKPLDEVYVATLPGGDAWKAACFLKIGGWNAMPSSSEHSALWRYWGERYGAKVACIADDVIEFTVERPPQTREEALALAKQQFIYCDDIVHQGVESVEALAATILNAGVWYFWWD